MRNFQITFQDKTRHFSIRPGVGPQGPAGTVTIGTTTTGDAGTNASVTNSGTPTAAILNFTIPRGEDGEPGEPGPNSVTSETTSDGTANLSLSSLTVTSQLDVGQNFVVSDDGGMFFGEPLEYNYEANAAANHRAALELDDMALLPNDGTATIDVLDATVQGTLTASHIHGNIAGSVYTHIRAGEDLAKGDPVYVSGFHSGTGRPIVNKADASNAAKMPAIGVMDAAVLNNANGHMVITGIIEDLNTNAYAVNTVLYVASGGGFTSTPPAANSQPVAIVERSNTTNGVVIVKVNGLASSGGNGASDANKLARFSSSGTLPIANIGGLGANVSTFLATPTSANLAAAVTDETGSGSLVFADGPTLTNPTVTNYTESVVSGGNTGTSQTLSLTNGTVQTFTLTGNCTFTMPTANAGKSFVVLLNTGAGGFTATFTGVKWPGNVAPTITATASRCDILTFIADGSAWYGTIAQNFTP